MLSDAFSLCTSLGVRDHVSYPYRITGKVAVLYILILFAEPSCVKHGKAHISYFELIA
jgi:hypothetical protein